MNQKYTNNHHVALLYTHWFSDKVHGWYKNLHCEEFLNKTGHHPVMTTTVHSSSNNFVIIIYTEVHIHYTKTLFKRNHQKCTHESPNEQRTLTHHTPHITHHTSHITPTHTAHPPTQTYSKGYIKTKVFSSSRSLYNWFNQFQATYMYNYVHHPNKQTPNLRSYD